MKFWWQRREATQMADDQFEALITEARRLTRSEDESDQEKADDMTGMVLSPVLSGEQAQRLLDALHDFGETA